MTESTREAISDIEKIEAQIQGLRDEVRDMMETLGKLSHEFAKVLLILSVLSFSPQEGLMRFSHGFTTFVLLVTLVVFL